MSDTTTSSKPALSMSDILKNIDSASITSIKDVMAVIAAAQSGVAADKPKTPKELDDLNLTLVATLTYAQLMLEKYSDFKDYVEALNHSKVDNLTSAIETSIRSFKDVVDAQTIYTSSWFSQLLMADEDKQLIAQTLIRACSPYTTAYQDLYQKIVADDSDVMEALRFPKE